MCNKDQRSAAALTDRQSLRVITEGREELWFWAEDQFTLIDIWTADQRNDWYIKTLESPEKQTNIRPGFRFWQ